MAGIVGEIEIEYRLSILNAQKQARADIAITLYILKNFKNLEQGMLHSAIFHLNENFGSIKNKTIVKIIKTLEKIDAILADDGTRCSYKIAKIGLNMGRAFFMGKYIKLGTPFFQTSFRNQVIGIIHEAGHIIGLNFLIPEFYEGSSSFLPTFYRLFNADDIAIFAFNMARQYELQNKTKTEYIA